MNKLLLAALLAVTIPCASQVNVQGSNIQVGGNITGATVPPTPQGNIFVQPNTGTVAAIGAASTSLNATTPIFQGTGYTTQYTSGGGNNGIANYFSLFPTGFAAVPPYDTSTESWPVPNSGAAFSDFRNNSNSFVGHNNAATNQSCAPYLGNNPFSECHKNYFDLQLDQHISRASYYASSGPGYNLGVTNLSNGALWTVRQHHFDVSDLYTRGIKQNDASIIHCYGGGDCGGDYLYMTTHGYAVDGAAEGSVALYASVIEEEPYRGTVATGATGAATLTTSHVSGSQAFTDSGTLLDLSATSYGGTITGFPFVDFGSGANPFMGLDFSGSSFPVSTAWGICTSGTNASANGKFQIPVSQTISCTLSSDTPGNFATGNNVCLVGQGNVGTASFTEQTSITAVSGSGGAGGSQSVTFNTRYLYGPKFLMMQGGMCGKFATPNGVSQPNANMAVGSTSSSRAIMTACSHSACTSTAASQSSINLILETLYNVATAHAVTFYPGAEIVGTQNNTPNTVQLATNTVTWTAGDSILGPNGAATNTTGLHIVWNQTTPENDASSAGLQIDNQSPALMGGMVRLNTFTPLSSFFNITNCPGGVCHAISDVVHFGGNIPNAGVINLQDTSPVNSGSIPWLVGSSGDGYPSIRSHGGTGSGSGHWLISADGWSAWDAINVPPVPTATGQIPVSISTADNTGQNSSDWQNVTPSGDCTMTTGGVFTCTHTSLTGAVTLTGGSFDPGTCDSNTVTVTGAVVGHAVSFSTSDGAAQDAYGIVSATVSATNTVRVQQCPLITHTFPSQGFTVSTY